MKTHLLFLGLLWSALWTPFAQADFLKCPGGDLDIEAIPQLVFSFAGNPSCAAPVVRSEAVNLRKFAAHSCVCGAEVGLLNEKVTHEKAGKFYGCMRDRSKSKATFTAEQKKAFNILHAGEPTEFLDFNFDDSSFFFYCSIL